MGRLIKNISFLFCCSGLVGLAVFMVLVLNVPSTLGQAKKALVDLNSASEKELEVLPGVGAATAKNITANRPYKSVDELSKAGLSAEKIETLKPLVTVGAAPSAARPETLAKPAPAVTAVTKTQPPAEKPTEKLAPSQKVNINTASKEQLEGLPGIGPQEAQAIIDGRSYQKTEDIMKVRGIKQGEFDKIKDLIFAGEPYHHEGLGPGPRPAHISRIEGIWLANINNRPGRLEFYWTGNAWAGRIWIDTLGQWEELTDVLIDPHTGQVQFYRPYGNQRYYGILSGERIEGTFGVGGPGNFAWAAWGHFTEEPLSRIEGIWFANINNRPGRLEFHWTGNAWTGRIWMDALGRWEELTDVFIDPRTRQVQFHRPYGNQRYYGTLSGERIEGTFGVGGPGNFPWAAWRH